MSRNMRTKPAQTALPSVGEPVEEMEVISVRMPRKWVKAIKAVARQDCRNSSSWIRITIRKALEQEGALP